MFYFNAPTTPTEFTKVNAPTALDFAMAINATYSTKCKVGFTQRRDHKLTIFDANGRDCTESALKTTLTLLALESTDFDNFKDISINLFCALRKVMKKRAFAYFEKEMIMLAINKVKFD
jgi:hypothetical protein